MSLEGEPGPNAGEGRVAVVTGAAAGIGRGIARRLIADGYRCAVVDLADAPPELAEAGALSLRADVTDQGGVAAAFGAVAEHYGAPVSVLVCNAGVVGDIAPVGEQSPENWARVIGVDLTGVFLCCRLVVDDMRAQGFGRIVNIASVAGKEGVPGMAPYCAAKAGVIGFTKALARELVTEGVTVNAVTPAVVRTELVEGMPAEHVEHLVSLIPMGRTAEISEVAAAVSFLVGEATFTTGSIVDVTGGRADY
jgi:NAD(P)-dependent dehydrogenase (short-subunit alcohol dehydrogenase family)